MPRKISPCPPVIKCSSPFSETLEYRIFLVTPMFGGGVEVREPDETQLIRATAIRGQLRFWWRATRGAAYEDAASLREREAAIWGDTKNPSRVQIEVELKTNAPIETYNPGDFGKQTYALFPFQETSGRNGEAGQEAATYLPAAEFNLTIHFNGQESVNNKLDVQAAVWAWINFGGLGSRTRRGCGSLFCSSISPSSHNSLSGWLSENIAFYELNLDVRRDWPTLAAFYISGSSKKSKDAWESAIKLMYDFRQGAYGRDNNKTLWPEAGSIRKVTQDKLAKYSDRSFPRAALGLPIITHFKDSGEPQDTELYPRFRGEDKGRMSSPIILKSLNISKDSGVPLLLRLFFPAAEGLGLKYTGKEESEDLFANKPLGASAIKNKKLTEYTGSPLKGRSEDGCAIEALCHIAEQRGFVKYAKK